MLTEIKAQKLRLIVAIFFSFAMVVIMEQSFAIKLLGELAPIRALMQGAFFMVGLQALVAMQRVWSVRQSPYTS